MTNRQWMSSLALVVQAGGLVLVLTSFVLSTGWGARALLAIGIILFLLGLMGGIAGGDRKRR